LEVQWPKGMWLLGVWQLLVNVAMAQRRCGNSLDVCKYWFDEGVICDDVYELWQALR
jgi:hypothetical protein